MLARVGRLSVLLQLRSVCCSQLTRCVYSIAERAILVKRQGRHAGHIPKVHMLTKSMRLPLIGEFVLTESAN